MSLGIGAPQVGGARAIQAQEGGIHGNPASRNRPTLQGAWREEEPENRGDREPAIFPQTQWGPNPRPE